MSRLSVPGPDVVADITREQVAAYLLANGWREDRMRGPLRCFQLGAEGWIVSVDADPGVGTIRAIATAMHLRPSDVLLGCAAVSL